MLLSTVVFALVAETLVDSLSPVLATLGLSEFFVGVTLIACVPNTAEFVNAIQFALQDNVSLSIEIASSAAAQAGPCCWLGGCFGVGLKPLFFWLLVVGASFLPSPPLLPILSYLFLLC